MRVPQNSDWQLSDFPHLFSNVPDVFSLFQADGLGSNCTINTGVWALKLTGLILVDHRLDLAVSISLDC